MARHLQILLGNGNAQFPQVVREFERASGNAGIDTKLIGDILERGHRVLRELRLDPSDTTPHELYQVLRSHHQTPELFADTEFVGLIVDGHIISLNGGDIIVNSNRGFEDRSLEHFRAALQRELVHRYAEHERTNTPTIKTRAKDAGLNIHVTKKKEVPARSKAPSMLMIGDIFTDAFIKLNEASARIIKEKDGVEWLALPFGQKPPYDHVDIIKSVGPSPNAAVSTSRLGLNASLMAWVGDDATGDEALEHLEKENISTESMVVEKDKLTSYWYVLRYGADRTMLVKSEKYDYKWRDPKTVPDWIYLSYIGEDSLTLHKDLAAYLDKHPQIKFAFQPGTFHFKWGAKKLAKLYKRAEIVVLNREEAVDVTGAPYESLHKLSEAMHALGPKIVVITDGPNGAYASYDDNVMTIPNYPDPAPPLDRTGAGDAFASTIVAALAHGKTMDEALTWAPINSMNVVQKMGAQAGLLTQKEIHSFIKKAPKNYKVSVHKEKK